MKENMAIAHMRVAHVYSQLSYCVRKKVGCIIVDGDRVVSIGYNGTPPGAENVCEIDGVTRSDVIHAEDNALRKINYKADNMAVFVTVQPCKSCAELLNRSNVSTVYYLQEYKNTDGTDYLKSKNIKVIKLDEQIILQGE